MKHCQTNTVDVDQTETIGHDQAMRVKHDRDKKVDNDEWVEIGHYRSEIVHGNEDWVIKGQRARTTTKDDLHTVLEGKREVTVHTGKDIETYKGGRETTVVKYDALEVDGNKTTDVSGQYNIKSSQHFKISQAETTDLLLDRKVFIETVGPVEIKSGNGAVHYDATAGGVGTLKARSELNFEAGDKLLLKVGASQIEMTGSKITISSPTIEINGASLVDIKSGGVVKLKC